MYLENVLFISGNFDNIPMIIIHTQKRYGKLLDTHLLLQSSLMKVTTMLMVVYLLTTQVQVV